MEGPEGTAGAASSGTIWASGRVSREWSPLLEGLPKRFDVDFEFPNCLSDVLDDSLESGLGSLSCFPSEPPLLRRAGSI